jgi:hypothetical protein
MSLVCNGRMRIDPSDDWISDLTMIIRVLQSISFLMNSILLSVRCQDNGVKSATSYASQARQNRSFLTGTGQNVLGAT